MAESLILWALQETDPDQGRKMTATDVLNRIAEVVPSAATVLDVAYLHSLMEQLSNKRSGAGRVINWHKSEDRFVLPYATRESLAEENVADENLLAHIQLRLHERSESLDPEIVRGLSTTSIAQLSLSALHMAFEHKGLEFAAFVASDDGDPEFPHMADSIKEAVAASEIGPALVPAAAGAALAVVRDCIYSADEQEREYLRRLAKTYSIFFLLRQDPKVIRYFEEMNSTFHLLVGSDLLVQAMSERLLPEENQTAANMLRMLHAAGATLILTEPVLDEVAHNLINSDSEFHNYYEAIENRLTPELTREVPKILVRAYLYNRSRESSPKNWESFVNLFCDYKRLRNPQGEDQLRLYFQAAYGMTYLSREDLDGIADPQAVSKLAGDLLALKSSIDLATNDALMVSAVYGYRKSNGETQSVNVFGYSTWWLTNETKVLRATREMVRKQGESVNDAT